MGASSMYRRPLGRTSAHRQSLLRNLVSSLIQHEQISTTFAKAKETQRLAEKLITLGKKNTNATRLQAESMVFQPEKHMDKVFGTLAKRYATRPGGYTRILRCEPLKDDAAKSAILCLVDGPKDMRFNMTARALLRQQEEGLPMNELTAVNVRKVTRFRNDGVNTLVRAVEHLTIEKKATKEKEAKAFEEKGERVEYTTDVPRTDPRFDERRGPGRLIKRRIAKDEHVDVRDR